MIGQHTIDRVKQETPIIEVVGESVKLQRRGRSHLGLCPFHQEKTPSFHVNEERGFFHCFGCGQSGDAIKFLQEIEGLSFTEAVRSLAERLGIQIEETHDSEPNRDRAEAKRREETLLAANEAAASFFERMLREHSLSQLAWNELDRRGLRSEQATGPIADALQAFRIGYAPYGWDGLSNELKTRGVSVTAAEKAGLIAARRTGAGYYDRFRHRLMFAVMDLRGRVVAFSGRALEEPSDAQLGSAGLQPMPRGDAVAKYINSPETLVYRKREAVFGLFQARQHIRTEDAAIVVEGNFDVVGLHARGLQNVVAPLGTAFTVEQARQVRRFSTHAILMFDGDTAGQKAVRAAREPCREAGLHARVARLPQGLDPDALSQQGGASAIRQLSSSARGLLEHLIDEALDSGFSIDDSQTRAAKIREVTELLRTEEDPSVRALAEQHADRIAQRLGIFDARTFRALAAQVRSALSQPNGRERLVAPAVPRQARSRDRREEIACEIFGALLDFPELIDTPELVAASELFEGDLVAALAALRQGHGVPSIVNPEEILAKLPTSIHPFALARLAAPRHEQLDDARAELVGNVKKLKRLELERRKPEVVEELQRVAQAGDFEQELVLLREQVKRARERHGLDER